MARPLTLLAALLVLVASIPAHADETVTTDSGLKVTVLEPGEGEPAANGDRVTFHYVAKLGDGTQFGSTYDSDRPFSTILDPDSRWLIQGLKEGLTHAKGGGKVRLEIPAALAYGKQGKGSTVPPDTDVVYDVEILDIQRAPTFHSPAEDEWTDVMPGLRYAVLKPGEGETPKPTQRVRLRYAVWNLDRALVQSTHVQKKKLDGMAGELRLAEPKREPGQRGPLKGERMFPLIVQKMKPGEIVWVEATAPHVWGASPAHKDVKPNSTTWWELELLDISETPEFESGDPEKTTELRSGLKYEVIREGTGRKAKAGRDIEVHYVGWLTNGQLFDTSFRTGGVFRTKLRAVIAGWIQGIALMREGSIYRFTIPGHLAYGERGSPPTIGPNATLVFWVECTKVW